MTPFLAHTAGAVALAVLTTPIACGTTRDTSGSIDALRTGLPEKLTRRVVMSERTEV